MSFDTHDVISRMRTFESLAILSRVSSTNAIARRVVAECVANVLSLPQAVIVAREQFSGRGRNDRRWSSPAGRGIYATMLLTRRSVELPLVPLAVANTVVSFVRETFAIDAGVKWPNDVMVGGRKLAGILIEARVQDDRTYLVIGVGINTEPFESDDRPNATSIAEIAPERYEGLDHAIEEFVLHCDRRLSRAFERTEVLEEWRSLTVHKEGDPIVCAVGTRTVGGRWAGIDDEGRARLRTGDEVVAVSAGEIIMMP